MKKQHLKYRLFSAIFDTQQSKDDVIGVIVTSFWICFYCPWEILCHSTIMSSLVVPRGSSFTEGDTMCPPRPIWYQNTPAWIGLKSLLTLISMFIVLLKAQLPLILLQAHFKRQSTSVCKRLNQRQSFTLTKTATGLVVRLRGITSNCDWQRMLSVR